MKGKLTSDQLNQSPMHLLHRAGQCADSLFEAQAEDSGLTPRQLAVLDAVANSEGPSQTELVTRTGIDRSTLSDVVRRLQKRHLLQRRRTKDDARTYAIALTDKGRQVLCRVEPMAKLTDEQLLGGLTSKQREQFIDALKSIVGAMPHGSMGG
jgi:MarR family transcriptional regulator, temperature-dependent positive regulator of motility